MRNGVIILVSCLSYGVPAISHTWKIGVTNHTAISALLGRIGPFEDGTNRCHLTHAVIAVSTRRAGIKYSESCEKGNTILKLLSSIQCKFQRITIKYFIYVTIE